MSGKHKRHYLHRVLAEAFLPNPDNLPQVDHIDGNGLNNSLDNLSWASVKVNARNRKSTEHTSQYMGVSWDNPRQRWSANIHIENKKKFLGRFLNELDAVRAYDAAAKEAGFDHFNL